MTGESLRQTVSITNPQGFHMRPMAAFVEAANRFPCSITVLRPGKSSANGKSMLALMGLVAEQGTELVIEATGPAPPRRFRPSCTYFSVPSMRSDP